MLYWYGIYYFYIQILITDRPESKSGYGLGGTADATRKFWGRACMSTKTEVYRSIGSRVQAVTAVISAFYAHGVAIGATPPPPLSPSKKCGSVNIRLSTSHTAAKRGEHPTHFIYYPTNFLHRSTLQLLRRYLYFFQNMCQRAYRLSERYRHGYLLWFSSNSAHPVGGWRNLFRKMGIIEKTALLELL